jgi:transcriptional regulator with XRE-family HTH domain
VRGFQVKSAAPKMVQGIGQRLVQIRGAVSQPARADQLGVHRNTYARWERSEADISAAGLAALAAEGWSTNWVLTGLGRERIATGVAETPAGPYGSQELSGEHLMVATELADEALAGLWLPLRRRFDLVALIYDALMRGLPYAEIIAFARPAAQDLAGGASDDERGAEVGGESAAGSGGG